MSDSPDLSSTMTRLIDAWQRYTERDSFDRHEAEQLWRCAVEAIDDLAGLWFDIRMGDVGVDGQHICEHCGKSYVPDYDVPQGLCSYQCSSATNRRYRQQQRERTLAKFAWKVEQGKPVCNTITNAGDPCTGSPLLGTDVCNSHASGAIRSARDYGKHLGSMLVSDDLCAEMVGDRPHFVVVDAYRRRGISDELRTASLP